MATRLVDTNVVSFLLKGDSRAALYQPHLAGHDLMVSFQTLAELLEWAAMSGWGPARWTRFGRVMPQFTVCHSTDDICARWAEIRAIRRAQPIATADCWIAATALAFGLELVTHNPSDFAGIPGLVVITEAP